MAESKGQTEALLSALFRLRNVKFGQPKPIRGIRHGETMLLFYLWHEAGQEADGRKGVTVKELSAAFCVTASSITQQLNPLEKADLIIRCVDPDDRRIVRIFLTQKGQEEILAARRSMLENVHALTAFLGPEDTAALIRILERVCDWRLQTERPAAI